MLSLKISGLRQYFEKWSATGVCLEAPAVAAMNAMFSSFERQARALETHASAARLEEITVAAAAEVEALNATSAEIERFTDQLRAEETNAVRFPRRDGGVK